MEVSRVSLIRALDLPERGCLLSIVGGGGKSALLFALGRQLPGRVLLTTTTRIFAAQLARAPASCELNAENFDAMLDTGPSGLLVLGAVSGDKAIGVDAALPARWLARGDFRHVIVEADGSRMLPAKAPADHEPSLAAGSTHVAIVVGIDALDGPIVRTVHRPERASRLLKMSAEATLSPADLAHLITHPDGGLKNVPKSARAIVVINKVESSAQRDAAAAIAKFALHVRRIERVVAGAIEPDGDSVEAPLWSVFRRNELASDDLYRSDTDRSATNGNDTDRDSS